MKDGTGTLEREKGRHASDPIGVDLKMSEERYRRLFETAQDGILIIDADTGLIDDVNPFLVNLLEYRREDFIGEPLWKFGPFRDIRASRTAFQKLVKDGYIRYKHLPLETRRGRRIEVEFISNVYQVGRSPTIQCNIRDDSVSKQDEKEREVLTARNSQAEKMAAVGTLAGGVAHQFNNALSIITLALDLVEKTALPAQKDPNIKLIKEMIRKMSRISGELLSYARGGKYRSEILCVTEIVRDCLRLFTPALRSSVVLETDLPLDLPKINIDRQQVRNALLAIVNNSLEAIETHGRIKIVCRQHMMTPERAKTSSLLPPGNYVSLTITDTGHGMDEETRLRVFEPFFTTRFTGRGLGMAAVYGIVKNHGGWIFIKSQPQQGTEVGIYFPALEWRKDIEMGNAAEPDNLAKAL